MCAGLFVALALTDLVVLLSSGLENLIAGGVGKLILRTKPISPARLPCRYCFDREVVHHSLAARVPRARRGWRKKCLILRK